MRACKRILLALSGLLGVVLLMGAALLVYLTIAEYRPEPRESVSVEQGTDKLFEGNRLTVLSWNVGYCGLGAESDFFMDGGSKVRPASQNVIETNLTGIAALLADANADFLLLQEVDTDSKRSYGVEEAAALREQLACPAAYALNYSCPYVPYPLPPLGRVHSGLLTLSRCAIREAERISLPCPFSWPSSVANLKRCLLVTRIPLAGTERELVLVNLHLEAYDDGSGRLAQSHQLREYLAQEYAAGNYVVAGGDWNQVFPDSEALWPNTHRSLWIPGGLDSSELASGWRYVWDSTVPTCRLLNQPYDPSDVENTQYYVIDGYLISPNLNVERVETLDEGFAFSDHNPVLLTLTMGE